MTKRTTTRLDIPTYLRLCDDIELADRKTLEVFYEYVTQTDKLSNLQRQRLKWRIRLRMRQCQPTTEES